MLQNLSHRRGIRKSGLLLLSGILLLAGTFASSYAEEVFLKNGTVITGRVSKISKDAVFISTIKGDQSISKMEIVRIRHTPLTPEQKAQLQDAQQKKKATIAQEREQIRQIKEADERRRLDADLDAKIRLEKEEEARAASLRAAALRELVAKGQMEKPKDEPISYKDFAWRSLVLPGWGHFYLNRPLFGVFYAGSTAAFLATVYETRNRALAARDENHRETELNFLLSLQPGLLNKEVRIAYSMQANAKALTMYQHKVDQYNGALTALAILYGAQLLHIIYNGIAWENGLLIVDNQKPDPGTLKGHIIAVPEYQGIGAERRAGVTVQGGLTVHF